MVMYIIYKFTCKITVRDKGQNRVKGYTSILWFSINCTFWHLILARTPCKTRYYISMGPSCINKGQICVHEGKVSLFKGSVLLQMG